MMSHIHIRQVGSKSEDHVKGLLVRCLDCDRLYELACDTAVGVSNDLSSTDFQRFARFLVAHSGHRITSDAIVEAPEPPLKGTKRSHHVLPPL